MKQEDLMEYFDETLYEMSNFRSNTTGLPPKVDLWVRTEPNEHGHVKYRIKISHPQSGDAVFAIWGDEIQQVQGNWEVPNSLVRKINVLVQNNTESFRKHIDGEEDSADLTDALRRTKPLVLKS